MPRTSGEEHLLYDGPSPAYAGLDPQHPSSLVYAINMPRHAPIPLGAMYIENGDTNGPQAGGSLTRWHSHLVVRDNGNRPSPDSASICGAPATRHGRYTSQLLHVWVVPYPGGVFSGDLSRAATSSAVRAVLTGK